MTNEKDESKKQEKEVTWIDIVEKFDIVPKNLETRLTVIEEKVDKILDKLERIAPQWVGPNK